MVSQKHLASLGEQAEMREGDGGPIDPFLARAHPYYICFPYTEHLSCPLPTLPALIASCYPP